MKLDLGGEEVVLQKEDLLIEMTQKEGFVSENNGDVTVVLDSNLTPELIEEGFVREVISKIQTMRKEAGFEVMDHIIVYHKDNQKIAEVVEKYKSSICSDVMADEIVNGDCRGYTKEWNINGETVALGVEKVG